MALRPTQGDENSFRPPTTVPGGAALPFVSAAQWRDLCVDALPWECFSTERSVVEVPAVLSPGSRADSLVRTLQKLEFFAACRPRFRESTLRALLLQNVSMIRCAES
jgi:hypothetical protein